MNKLEYNEMSIKWYNDVCFDFLKTGTSFNLSEDMRVPISVYINTPSPIDADFDSVVDKFPIVQGEGLTAFVMDCTSLIILMGM